MFTYDADTKSKVEFMNVDQAEIESDIAFVREGRTNMSCPNVDGMRYTYGGKISTFGNDHVWRKGGRLCCS